MTKKADKSAASPNAPEAPTVSAMSHEEAAKLAGIKVKEVFAVNEYENRYHVITTDGQKHVVKK